MKKNKEKLVHFHRNGWYTFVRNGWYTLLRIGWYTLTGIITNVVSLLFQQPKTTWAKVVK